MLAFVLGAGAALVAVELALWLLATTSRSPLLFIDGTPLATIERFRLEPHSAYLGHRTNAGGYNDGPFAVGGPDLDVIAVVGAAVGGGCESFQADHSSTTTLSPLPPRPPGVSSGKDFGERAPGRVADTPTRGDGRGALHNFGVPAIGVPEYEWLLASEVPAYVPRAAVVVLFLANDLASAIPRPRRWLDLREWRTLIVLGRVARWAEERRRESPGVSPAPAAEPWTESSEPSMSHDAYARVVASQWRSLDPAGPDAPARLEALLAALSRMRARAGFPILVALAPADPQVSNRSRAEFVETRPELARMDVDAVHEMVAARLRADGFETLDLLPVLRAAEQGASTYHPRDSHWNVRGNAVAGRALADFLARTVLGPDEAPPALAR